MEETSRAIELEAQGHDHAYIARQLGKTWRAVKDKLWSLSPSKKPSALDTSTVEMEEAKEAKSELVSTEQSG